MVVVSSLNLSTLLCTIQPVMIICYISLPYLQFDCTFAIFHCAELPFILQIIVESILVFPVTLAINQMKYARNNFISLNSES